MDPVMPRSVSEPEGKCCLKLSRRGKLRNPKNKGRTGRQGRTSYARVAKKTEDDTGHGLSFTASGDERKRSLSEEGDF